MAFGAGLDCAIAGNEPARRTARKTTVVPSLSFIFISLPPKQCSGNRLLQFAGPSSPKSQRLLAALQTTRSRINDCLTGLCSRFPEPTRQCPWASAGQALRCTNQTHTPFFVEANGTSFARIHDKDEWLAGVLQSAREFPRKHRPA